MACFSVPLATAVAAEAAKRLLPEAVRQNIFVARLSWLGKMMFGGSFLLAIEHVYHGEIVLTPPFLTAVKDGNVADMVHEMATRGVAMAVLLVVVWTGMVITSTIMENNKGKVVANV